MTYCLSIPWFRVTRAVRNVVLILRVWPQCCDMNGGLSSRHAWNKMMCVPFLNFRFFVTCKSPDWLVCIRRRREQSCLSSGWRNSVISSEVFIPPSSVSHTHTHTHSLSMLQLTWDKAHMNSIFSHRQPKQPKTTTKNACWRMQIGRKSIKNKQGRQSGEMKGGSEGRQMEFSTSVTLAGLSIMCDVVETGRWSERPCRSSPGSLICFSLVDTGQDRLFIFLHTQQKTYRGTCVFRYKFSPSTIIFLLCTRSRGIQRF